MKYKGKKCWLCRNGYFYVDLKIDGKYRKRLVHRMIMQDHLGYKLLPDQHVHHINGNKTDNSLINLEVLSKSKHHRLTMLTIGQTKEYRDKMSKVKKRWARDVGFSEEHRKKISEAAKGHKSYMTDKGRIKLSKSLKKYWEKVRRGEIDVSERNMKISKSKRGE